MKATCVSLSFAPYGILSVSLKGSPERLHGKQHIIIICNHQTAATRDKPCRTSKRSNPGESAHIDAPPSNKSRRTVTPSQANNTNTITKELEVRTALCLWVLCGLNLTRHMLPKKELVHNEMLGEADAPASIQGTDFVSTNDGHPKQGTSSNNNDDPQQTIEN